MWDLFFDKQVLEEVADSLKLRDHERRHLTEDSMRVLKNRMAQFTPRNDIPRHVIESGQFRVGTQISKEKF